MKTFISYFHRAWITARLGGLLLLGSALFAASSLAATIAWSGAGGDELWSNPANWTGGAVPTALDDVVIDVPGDVTVRMDAANTIVRSVLCEEGLIIENGSFTVTNGVSVVNGLFAVKPPYELKAIGPSTRFTVNGPVTNLCSLWAYDGAVLSFPTVQALTFGRTSPLRWITWGAGSAILLTNLSHASIEPGYLLELTAQSGARIDVSRLQVPSGSLHVSVQDADSLVDLSGFNGLWSQGFNGGSGCRLSAGRGGTVLIPNVTSMEQMNLDIRDSANVNLNQLRSFNGSINLDSRTNGFNGLTNFSGSVSVSSSWLDWTNVTSLKSDNESLRITAYNNSFIDLSGVTNVSVNPSYRFTVTAFSDSHIDLSRLRQPAGMVEVESRLGGSVVDLSGFTGLWEGKGSSIRVEDGDSVLIPNVTALKDVSLSFVGGSYVPTAQIRSIVGGSIGLRDRTNGFEGLTNFSANLSASNTRLDLTNLTVIYATNVYVDIQAYGNSFIDLSRVTNVVATDGYRVFASAFYGGRIDLSGLTSPDADVSAQANGLDSLVDLSGLSGLWEPGISAGSLYVTDGGTLSIPNITAMKGVSLSISGNTDLDLSRIESMIDGSLSFTACTNSLDALTNFSGSLTANNAEIILTNLTTLLVTNRNNHFFSVERGGILNLSNVTRFITAPDSGRVFLDVSRNGGSGGRIDLSGLIDPGGAYLWIWVASPNAVLDLSGLSGLWTNASASVGSGGTLLIPNVTAMDGIGLSIGAGQVPLSQLQSFVNGSLLLQLQTNVFDSLTNFSGTMNSGYQGWAKFPALTQLVTTNGNVQFTGSGGHIDLSHVTNAIVKSHALNISASADSRVDLSSLETIVAGDVGVSASGANAVVDLSGLSGFFSDNNGGRFSTSSGGVILLNSDAMLITGVTFDLQSNPGGPVPPFLAPSQSLVLYGQPWRSYRVEARNPAVPGSTWGSYLPRVALTNTLLNLGARPPRNLILRVYAFVADPPEVDVRLVPSNAVEAILFGVPGRAYRLQIAKSFDEPIGWHDGPAVTLTNSFFIFPQAGVTNVGRFYRARQL